MRHFNSAPASILKHAMLCAGLFAAASGSAQSGQDQGKPFTVSGEQLQHPIPKGWKLAWMEGTPDGGYLAEYIPQADDINNWREGYLSIQRAAYPGAAVVEQIAKANAKVSDVALVQFMKMAADNCGGHHQAMSKGTNTFNGVHFAVSGGYCDKYGPAAPFGEGSVIAYVDGRDYLFRIQYSWRPKDEQAQKDNLPWRIAPAVSTGYMLAIKESSLCGGGGGQPACGAKN